MFTNLQSAIQTRRWAQSRSLNPGRYEDGSIFSLHSWLAQRSKIRQNARRYQLGGPSSLTEERRKEWGYA